MILMNESESAFDGGCICGEVRYRMNRGDLN